VSFDYVLHHPRWGGAIYNVYFDALTPAGFDARAAEVAGVK